MPGLFDYKDPLVESLQCIYYLRAEVFSLGHVLRDPIYGWRVPALGRDGAGPKALGCSKDGQERELRLNKVKNTPCSMKKKNKNRDVQRAFEKFPKGLN